MLLTVLSLKRLLTLPSLEIPLKVPLKMLLTKKCIEYGK